MKPLNPELLQLPGPRGLCMVTELGPRTALPERLLISRDKPDNFRRYEY